MLCIEHPCFDLSAHQEENNPFPPSASRIESAPPSVSISTENTNNTGFCQDKVNSSQSDNTSMRPLNS